MITHSPITDYPWTMSSLANTTTLRSYGGHGLPLGEVEVRSVFYILADYNLHGEARAHLPHVFSLFNFTEHLNILPGLTAVLYFLKDSRAFYK